MEKRAQERQAVSLIVEILDPTHHTKKDLVTKDISKSGAFILINRDECIPVGRVVSLRLPDTTWGAQLSNVSARVVRVTDEGMGLRFLDFDIM